MMKLFHHPPRDNWQIIIDQMQRKRATKRWHLLLALVASNLPLVFSLKEREIGHDFEWRLLHFQKAFDDVPKIRTVTLGRGLIKLSSRFDEIETTSRQRPREMDRVHGRGTEETHGTDKFRIGMATEWTGMNIPASVAFGEHMDFWNADEIIGIARDDRLRLYESLNEARG